MPAVPGLRSPYAMVGRLVYFGRMLDKIRLQAAGTLPPDYGANVGDEKPLVFDARTCRFLGVKHAELAARTLQGGTDEEILAWTQARGTPRTDEDCLIWNQFMMKIGWRDDRGPALRQRIAQFGLVGKSIETSFDFLDVDEGRDPIRTRSWELRPAQAIVIMGVSGSGKTTIGVKLAQTLGWNFRDADDFHSPANVAKMAAGIPLDDADRAPWLQAIRAYLADALAQGESTVVTCSALKETYRRVILADEQKVKLVYLKGDFELILRRMEQRQGHYMKENMLRSQFEALERPQGAFEVEVAHSPERIVEAIRRELAV